MTPPIFGLTLKHPWAAAIHSLGKDVENRTWHPKKWGGCVGMHLAIHGGTPPNIMGNSEKAEEFRDDVYEIVRIAEQGHISKQQILPFLNDKKRLDMRQLIMPGIVAIARVSAVRDGDFDSPWAARTQKNWVLVDITPIEPVKFTGGRGLWRIEDYTKGILRERWAQAHDGEVVF